MGSSKAKISIASETIHFCICPDLSRETLKTFLGVCSSTNDSFVLGENGIFPLCDYYCINSINYWIKLHHMPDHRLPSNCYKLLNSLDDSERNT